MVLLDVNVLLYAHREDSPITLRDFSRFPDLRWRHPLAEHS